MELKELFDTAHANRTRVYEAGENKGYESGYKVGETDGYDKGFTEGQESVDAIYKTSGTIVLAYNDNKVNIPHGLPKNPKLIVCFRKDYTEYLNTNIASGFIWNDKVWTAYHNNIGIGVPSKISSPYWSITVDDTNVLWKWLGEYYPIRSAEYFWEAYTW